MAGTLMKDEVTERYQAAKEGIATLPLMTPFLSRFSTTERLHKWQNQLMNFRQGPSEKVKVYAAKEITSLNAAVIPDSFKVRMFLKELKEIYKYL